MTTNQSFTNVFSHTYKTGLKGLPILPALANFGILAFFVTFFTGVEILSKQVLYNQNGEQIGHISSSSKYLSFFFGAGEELVMPTLVFQVNRRIKSIIVRKAIFFLTILFTTFMVTGRLISGVHWFTDIVGSVIISAGLYFVYKGFVFMWCKEEGRRF